MLKQDRFTDCGIEQTPLMNKVSRPGSGQSGKNAQAGKADTHEVLRDARTPVYGQSTTACHTSPMPSARYLPVRPPVLDVLIDALDGPYASVEDSGEHDWVPPELWAFGRTGVDNGVYGMVVPAPEVRTPTWYSAAYTWADGATELYDTCHAGVSAFLFKWAGTVLSDAGMRHWDIRLRTAAAQRVVPPPNMVVVDGTDKLPIWVPTWSWRDSDVGRRISPDGIPSRMEELIADGRPGSALYLGRALAHVCWRSDEYSALAQPAWRGLAAAYGALGRDAYAAIANARGGVSTQLAPNTREPGEVPASGVTALSGPLSRALTGFAGIRGGTVAVGDPVMTKGPMELTLKLDVSLDPTRRLKGSDCAVVRLAQGFDGNETLGPLVAQVLVFGERIPPHMPPPPPGDAAATKAYEQGFFTVDGPLDLEMWDVDLIPFAAWLD